MNFAKARCTKEVKMMDKLLKSKQILVYVSPRKLTLLVLQDKYDSLVAGHRGEKNDHRMV